MFRIFSCPPGSFVNIPNWINVGNGSYPRILYCPIIGPFNSKTGEITSIELGSYKGEINTSPKDEFGERNCLHRKPDGDIMVPGFTVTEPNRKGYYDHYYQTRDTSSGIREFSSIVSNGTCNERFTRIGASSLWHDRTIVQDRNVLSGYVKYANSPAKLNYLTVDIRCFTFTTNWKQYSSRVLFSFTRKATYDEYQWFLDYLRKQNVTTLALTSLATTELFTVSGKLIKVDEASIKRAINVLKDHGTYDPMIPTDLKYTWGGLAQSAADQLDYCSVNVIAFLRELRDWRTLIPKLGKILSPKTWSDWYLSYRYGLTLTVKDTKAIVQSLQDSFSESIHSMNLKPKIIYAAQSKASIVGIRAVESTYRYKVICDRYPSTVMNIVRELKQWGLYPTLLNAWDMIPYSFVVDWFVSFDDLFKELDARIFWQYINVLSVCRSQKHTTVLSGKDLLPNYFVTGDVNLTIYWREIRRHMDLPPITLDTPSGFRNYAELTALIVQRR